MPPWIPTPPECRALLLDAEVPDWVVGHCGCVANQARAFADAAAANGHACDLPTVTAGALLHDIGRSVTHDLRHAGIGADLLRDAGVAEVVCRIAETHTGGGITRDEAAAAGLPDRDYLPATLEERVVCHADNCYSGDKRLTWDALRAKYDAKGLPGAWARIEALDAGLRSDLRAKPFGVLPATADPFTTSSTGAS